MSLSRKRKKELQKLQSQANNLWATQQQLVGNAAEVAREASRQLNHYGREQVAPQVQAGYGKSIDYSRHLLSDRVVPAAGAVVGSALSVWDAANDTRVRLSEGKGFGKVDSAAYAKKADKYTKQATKKLAAKLSVLEPEKQGIGAGGVIAIVLGVAAALGVLYAAWQTLRADDELWVADDPLRAPDA
ncbi:DNA helicase (plasmid) [Coraliomargarita sp. W4R53]